MSGSHGRGEADARSGRAPFRGSLDSGRLARAAVAGLFLGAAGALLHRHTVQFSGLTIPWGAVLAIAAVAVRCRVVRGEDGAAARCSGLALGWLTATMALALLHTGDLVIASDVLGVGYLLVGALVIGVCATWPTRSERQRWAAWRR